MDARGICEIYPMFFVDNVTAFSAGTLTVADVAGQVVGFVLWAPSREPAWFERSAGQWAILEELHLHPRFQNRGIGTRLVRAAIGQTRRAGFDSMYLETEADNVSARRTYEKGGFSEHSVIVRYGIRFGPRRRARARTPLHVIYMVAHSRKGAAPLGPQPRAHPKR